MVSAGQMRTMVTMTTVAHPSWLSDWACTELATVLSITVWIPRVQSSIRSRTRHCLMRIG
jgi:hypothetical protein